MAMETGIGQGKTLVSPLHMALIASAVDHDGILMRPYLVNNIQNDSGVEVSSNKPKTYATLGFGRRINTVNIWSAFIASSIVTFINILVSGFIVVSHNCSGFISPRPLYL